MKARLHGVASPCLRHYVAYAQQAVERGANRVTGSRLAPRPKRRERQPIAVSRRDIKEEGFPSIELVLNNTRILRGPGQSISNWRRQPPEFEGAGP